MLFSFAFGGVKQSSVAHLVGLAGKFRWSVSRLRQHVGLGNAMAALPLEEFGAARHVELRSLETCEAGGPGKREPNGARTRGQGQFSNCSEFLAHGIFRKQIPSACECQEEMFSAREDPRKFSPNLKNAAAETAQSCFVFALLDYISSTSFSLLRCAVFCGSVLPVYPGLELASSVLVSHVFLLPNIAPSKDCSLLSTRLAIDTGAGFSEAWAL